jgi:hypothetical protein
MMETLVGGGRCRFALTMAWRIRVGLIAAGRGPARGEIGSASSQSNGSDHDVSIRMTSGFGDGRW